MISYSKFKGKYFSSLVNSIGGHTVYCERFEATGVAMNRLQKDKISFKSPREMVTCAKNRSDLVLWNKCILFFSNIYS